MLQDSKRNSTKAMKTKQRIMSNKVLIVQGPAVGSEVPVAFLACEHAQVKCCIGNDPPVEFDISPYNPFSFSFKVDQGMRVSANISVTFPATKTVRVMRGVMLGGHFDPSKRFLARSCDALGFSFRESIIDKLRQSANDAPPSSNSPLFTIGDAIYADKGFVKPSGVDKDFRAQYARAWVETFDALADVTASHPNIHLADDHELWDNFDMQLVENTPHLKAGLDLMREIYAAFMGPFRRSDACNPISGAGDTLCPYDTYSFRSGNTNFAMLGKGLANNDTSMHLRSLRSTSNANCRLVAVCGSPLIEVSANRIYRLYYFITGKKNESFSQAGGGGWNDLKMLAESEDVFNGGVQVISGDMHEYLREKYCSVDLVVTSPFCNQTGLSAPLINASWKVHRVPNFAEIEGDKVKFHEQPVSFARWCRNGIRTGFNHLFIF